MGRDKTRPFIYVQGVIIMTLKGKIRNRDGRICKYCSKDEIENGTNPDIHHINGNKMIARLVRNGV